MRKRNSLALKVSMLAIAVLALFSLAATAGPENAATTEKDGYKTSTTSISGSFEDDRAWVYITGNSSYVSARAKDIRKAQKVRNGDEDLFYFRRHKKSWVLRDADSMSHVERILEPQRALGREQAKLGDAQGVLGDKQSELGDVQSELGEKQADLGRLQADAAESARRGDRAAQMKARELQHELSAMQAELGRRQGELGRQQGLLGQEQGKLGRMQGELGKKQGALAREAWGQFEELVERAIASGVAAPVG